MTEKEKFLEEFLSPDFVSLLAKSGKNYLVFMAADLLIFLGESYLDQISALCEIPPESVIEARNEFAARSREDGRK
jgi:hypothetical protein